MERELIGLEIRYLHEVGGRKPKESLEQCLNTRLFQPYNPVRYIGNIMPL